MRSFKGIKILLLLSSAMAIGAALPGGVFAQGDVTAETGYRKVKNPETYGTTLMDRATRDSKDIRPVEFPHWIHRSKYTCKLCHTDLGFPLKANEVQISQADMAAGKYCGTCHDGKISFGVNEKDKCVRCHSYGLNVKENKRLSDTTGHLPKYEFGNKIDWAAALKSAKILPESVVKGIGSEPKNHPSKVIIPSNKFTPAPPDVMFPHATHTEMLACETCHPKPFSDKQGGGGTTDMNMMKISWGQYCGMCHGKVSFPLEDCFRCHSQPPVPPPTGDEDKKDDKAKDSKDSKDSKPAGKK